MIYVYAFTDLSVELPPGVRGLGEEPIEFVVESGVGVVISRHASGAFGPTPENVCRHERVVESLMREGALLPARFGATFSDESALRAAVGSRAEVLLRGLDRVRDCVELGVRVLDRGELRDPHPVVAEGNSGRAWMQARLARERQERERAGADRRLASSIHAPLASLSRDSRLRVRPGGGFVLSAAYLVARTQVDEFAGRVERLVEELSECRLLCTGPWPPYNFAPALGEMREAEHV